MINKQVIVSLGKFVLAEVVAAGTAYAVTEHLDKMDDVHDEICGTETSALKMVSNSIAGTASGWVAGVITLVLTKA